MHSLKFAPGLALAFVASAFVASVFAATFKLRINSHGQLATNVRGYQRSWEIADFGCLGHWS